MAKGLLILWVLRSALRFTWALLLAIQRRDDDVFHAFLFFMICFCCFWLKREMLECLQMTLFAERRVLAGGPDCVFCLLNRYEGLSKT